MAMAMAFAFLGLLTASNLLPNLPDAVEPSTTFDVRQHISTSTSYAAGKSIKYGDGMVETTPEGCDPIHINLVARHGSRNPTEKTIADLDKLADRLCELAAEADKPLNKSLAWMKDFKSPWSGEHVGGELLPKGEEEHYDLAQRFKMKYPQIFSDLYRYHSDVYPIIATQITRSAASAVAFGMGLFSGQGTLGGGKHRAFSVISESNATDFQLRFHDNCETYKDEKTSQKELLAEPRKNVSNTVAEGVKGRYGLAVTGEDVSALWVLCKNEASLLDVVDRACGLFTEDEIEKLEGADDLEIYLQKGYGQSINYKMGTQLLKDVFQTMERAILADRSSKKVVEKARLRFAHAETVIPFICLLGLFSDGADYEEIKSEKALEASILLAHDRQWRTALISPFAANTALVLHKCPADDGAGVKYLVQALHNEKPVIMPGCNGASFCPFETFKAQVYEPHNIDFGSICNRKERNHPRLRYSWSLPKHWLPYTAFVHETHHSESYHSEL